MQNLHISQGMAENLFAIALAHLLKQRGRGAVSALAGEVGISQPQVSRIASGESSGSVEAREKIAIALGVSMEQMLELGRHLSSGDRRLQHRRANDARKDWLPNIRKLLFRFPGAEKYVAMAELAAGEDDIPLVITLIRSALNKVEESVNADDVPRDDSIAGPRS